MGMGATLSFERSIIIPGKSTVRLPRRCNLRRRQGYERSQTYRYAWNSCCCGCAIGSLSHHGCSRWAEWSVRRTSASNSGIRHTGASAAVCVNRSICRQPGSPVLHAELLFHQREHVYAWRTSFLLAPGDRVREPDAPGRAVLCTGALAARIAGGSITLYTYDAVITTTTSTAYFILNDGMGLGGYTVSAKSPPNTANYRQT